MFQNFETIPEYTYFISNVLICFDSNKSPTRCNNFPVYYLDVYLQLNMFRAFFRPSSGARWLQWQPARPRTQHDYHHDTKVKPQAATAVIELLMMDGKTPETCWAVNIRQDNKLENFCIWLVIYLNCTMMHGLTNLESTHMLFNPVGDKHTSQIAPCCEQSLTCGQADHGLRMAQSRRLPRW
jgi:hypothetical protein